MNTYNSSNAFSEPPPMACLFCINAFFKYLKTNTHILKKKKVMASEEVKENTAITIIPHLICNTWQTNVFLMHYR